MPISGQSVEQVLISVLLDEGVSAILYMKTRQDEDN